MTPLSEALTAAQRSALAALEKAYVAERIDSEEAAMRMKACGISDEVDISFLLTSLDVLKEWGVAAPTMTERVAAENEPASDKQWRFIRELAERLGVEPPGGPLTKAKASEAITLLQNGDYRAEDWVVPF